MALRKLGVRNAAMAAVEMLEERQFLSATLSITNPDAVPGSYNRLFFNTIGTVNPSYPSEAQNVHNSQTLILKDTGSDPLTIVGPIGVTGPFTVTGGPAAGANTVIQPGASLTLTVTFTQSSVPAHSANETNYNNNTNGGASITGSLTINSNDSTTPTTTWGLAGYYQTESESNAEPDLSQIVNVLAGYDTTLINPSQVNSTYPTDFPNGATTANYYGSEVVSNAWTAANPADPVTITYLANFRTIGNTVDTYWYSSNGTTTPGTSHLIFSSQPAEGQTLLPSTTVGGAPMTASFTPNGSFGFRVDSDEYSYDAINQAIGNTGGGGHHFRFYPLIDSNGNAVPNTWIVAMDYAVIQSENFDFQDNVYIVQNMMPTSAPPAPTGLTATSSAHPTLNWNAVTYTAGTLEGYNIYSSLTPGGTYTLLNNAPVTSTTFTDSANTNGGATLYYRVTAVGSQTSSDPNAPTESAPATVTANTPVGPVAGSFTVTATSGQAININPLVYDSDETVGANIEPSSLTVSFSGTGHGTLSTPTANGVFSYTSTSGFTGTDTITYTVRDTNNLTATGTITVSVVAGAVTTTSATADTANTTANSPVTIDVLANDTVASGQSFNLSSVTVTNDASHGSTSVDTSTGEITYTPNSNFVGADSFTYSVTDSAGKTVTANVSVAVGVVLTPNAGKAAIRAVKYTDLNGSAVTVTLNRGQGDIYFNGTGSEGAPVKGVLTLSGGFTIANIALSATTAASTLAITAAHNGAVHLGGITDASPLGVVSAKTAAFDGTIDLAAGVKQLVLASAGNSTAGTPDIITLGPTDVNPNLGAAIQNDTVQIVGLSQNTDLISTVALKLVKASGWIDSVQDVATDISAPTITTLQIVGTMQADLTLTGAAAYDLGTAVIKGTVNSGVWSDATGARTISITNATNGWGGANITTTLGTFADAGALPSDVTATTIGVLSAKGGLSGDVSATTIKTLAAAGGISGATIHANGNIATISAPAGITNSSITAVGNINTIAAGLLSGDTITAGVTTTGVTFADVTTATIGSGTIGVIKVAGKSATFADTDIIAHTINSASLGPVNSSNGGTPFGVAIVSTKSLTANENGTIVRVTSKSTTSPSAFGDFQIKLVNTTV